MPPQILSLLLASVAAVAGVLVSFAVVGAPKMLESQPISKVFAAGLKLTALFAPLYIIGTFMYGWFLLWIASLLGSRSFVVFLLLGVLPALAYTGLALALYGVESGWERALLFHGIPGVFASVTLWFMATVWRT